MTLASFALSKGGRRGTMRAALALAGAILLASLAAGQGGNSSVAHAATGLYYQSGYSVQGSWLCYGWSNGTYHCTQHWTQANGHYVSYNRAWVPDYAQGTTQAISHYSTPAHKATVATRTVRYSASPGGIGPWAYTGHPAYSMRDFAGDPYHGYFGYCTWYVWYRHQSEPLMQLGNAAQWAYTASSHGLRVGTTPAVGATAVFQPGVQGASTGGHVAHVEAVYGNGWFLVSEMSFYWNGGGWGRVSYRYVHAGPGVLFIY